MSIIFAVVGIVMLIVGLSAYFVSMYLWHDDVAGMLGELHWRVEALEQARQQAGKEE